MSYYGQVPYYTSSDTSVKKKVIANIIVLILFTAIYVPYFILVPEHWGAEDDPLYTKIHKALYFNVITHTTIGYGDISPNKKKAVPQLIVMIHALLVLFINIIL